MKIELEGGKYTLLVPAPGYMLALRYGEAWRDLTGDKMIGAMFNMLVEQQAKLNAIVARLNGVFDDPDLMEYGGALSTAEHDIQRIAMAVTP